MNRDAKILDELREDIIVSESDGQALGVTTDHAKALVNLIERLALECLHWRRGCTGKHGSQSWCCAGDNDLNGILPSASTQEEKP